MTAYTVQIEAAGPEDSNWEAPETIKIGALYPIAAGEPRYAERNTRVRCTAEKRVPRKGEWFLSGSIIEGYRARWDYSPGSMRYHIGELVEGELVWRAKA